MLVKEVLVCKNIIFNLQVNLTVGDAGEKDNGCYVVSIKEKKIEIKSESKEK